MSAEVNIAAVIDSSPGVTAVTAGDFLYAFPDLGSAAAEGGEGFITVRLLRGNATLEETRIPIQFAADGRRFSVSIDFADGDSGTATIPAGTTLSSAQVYSSSVSVSTSAAAAGAVTIALVSPPSGWALTQTGNSFTVTYSGARPTANVRLTIRASSPQTDSALASSADFSLLATLIDAPKASGVALPDRTVTSLTAFSVDVATLFTPSSGLTYTPDTSNPAAATVGAISAGSISITPVAEGETEITFTASNSAGTASRSFTLSVEVLPKPTLTWSSANYNTSENRYEFSVEASGLEQILGTVTATASVASPAIAGAVTYAAEGRLASLLDWAADGTLTARLNAFVGSAIIDGVLTATAAQTMTAAGETSRRNIRITASSIPDTPQFGLPSYSFNLPDGTDPPPSFLVGTLSASRPAGASQQWRIVSGNTDAMRAFRIAQDGRLYFDGPSAADDTVSRSYSLVIGVKNVETGVESAEASVRVEVSVTGAAEETVRRNPSFAPTGGLSRTVVVGQSFDIDFAGALIPATAEIIPVAQNLELISVSKISTTAVRCTGLRVGTTSYIVSGVIAVRVQVLASAPAATTSAWYRDVNGTVSAAESLVLTASDRQDSSNIAGDDPLYLTMTQIESRAITIQERPPLSGLTVSLEAAAALTLQNGSTVQARRVVLATDASEFAADAGETFALNLLAESDAVEADGVTYDAHTARLPTALTIDDSFIPTAAPDFGEADTAANLPAGSDGTKNEGVSVGTFSAGSASAVRADYTTDFPDDFSVVRLASGAADLRWIGSASDAYIGNAFTVTITATNSMGSDTLQVVVTVKGAVTLSLDPSSDPGWKLPEGQFSIELGTFTVNQDAPARGALPPVPTVAISGTDAADIRAVPVSHNSFTISFVGDAKELTAADLEFTLTANSAENGLCLAAAPVSLDFEVEVVPETPVFPQTSYDYTLTDGANPPPDITIGTPTASHSAVQTQRWRIIAVQTGRRLFAINATTGEMSYTGPDSASRADQPNYTLVIGVVNIQGSKQSREATTTVRIAVESPYQPPVQNANWSPGSDWTRNRDGSFSARLDNGVLRTVDITAGATGPYTFEAGRTVTYRYTTTNIVAASVVRTGGSFDVRTAGIGTPTTTLTLYASDGITEEAVVLHIAVDSGATQASAATWYRQEGTGYLPIDDKGITLNIPEGQTAPVSATVYINFTDADRRPGTLAEPTLTGFDIVSAAPFQTTITVAGERIPAKAYQINVTPASFDFETQRRYDLTATFNSAGFNAGGGVHLTAVHKQLAIHLNITNVDEQPRRTTQAAPADFSLRRRGSDEEVTLFGLWESRDNPDANNLAFRLVQTVVGASGGQSTTPGDYVTASISGTTFRAYAGASATLTPTGVRIRFDVYCREASTNVENPTPATFYCDSVHARALENSPLMWASTVPTRLVFSVPENRTAEFLLRNDIYAVSTVADMSASAGALTYALEEATFWIEKNTAFSWTAIWTLAAGGTASVDMATAFRIAGADAAGKTWTLDSATPANSAALTISISGTTLTLTGADDLAQDTTTTFVVTGFDGIFTETYTGSVTVSAGTVTITLSAKTLTATPAYTVTNAALTTITTGFSVSGTGQTAADPLTLSLGSGRRATDTILLVLYSELFEPPTGLEFALGTISPTSVAGTTGNNALEFQEGYHSSTFAGGFEMVAKRANWTAAQIASGVTAAVTIDIQEPASGSSASRTLYIKVEDS